VPEEEATGRRRRALCARDRVSACARDADGAPTSGRRSQARLLCTRCRLPSASSKDRTRGPRGDERRLWLQLGGVLACAESGRAVW
jgi:hypothetical protein